MKNKEYKTIDDSVTPKPKVGAYTSIGRFTADWWQVASELIDNTIVHSRDTKVIITLDTSKKTFLIKDNSIGIEGKYLESVISAGERVNTDDQVFSFSGMGMKASIYHMGTSFVIETKPRSEAGHNVYKLTPNFVVGEDPNSMLATFKTEGKVDKMRGYGTTITVSGLKNYPHTVNGIDKAVVWLGATYAERLESGQLEIDINFLQSNNKMTTFTVEPIKPLLTNKNAMLDTKINVGENEWEQEDTIKGDAGNGWEVKIKAGRKLHPENAEKYYDSTNRKLVTDVYSDTSSPYNWTEKTSGIDFKMHGKVIVFNTERATSRSTSLCVEIDMIKGIEPAMNKMFLNTGTAEYKEMMVTLKEWLEDNGFRSRTKVGTQALGENKDVRDKYRDAIRDDEIKRAEWGISLDTFDEQVSTETQFRGGRPDVYINGDNKKIIVECKKEVIDGTAISQAAGYALEKNADMIIMVAQDMTDSGTYYQSMWTKQLEIPIIFENILNYMKK